MRERGLKQICVEVVPRTLISLPMRERGLKQLIVDGGDGTLTSLPMRERGLKRRSNGQLYRELYRSPCGSVD